MKRIVLFSVVALSVACSVGTGDFTPPSGQVTYEVKPNGGDKDSPCGTIVDGEPAPGGKTCCTDGTHYETFYADGSQSNGACSGDDVCHVGTCGGVWNPDTLSWQVYSKL